MLYSFENALSADNRQVYFGEDGVLYTYHLDGANDWLMMWNQSKCFDSTFFYSFTPEVAGLGNYYPTKGTFDWRTGIEWNVTIPHHEGYGRSTDPSGISESITFSKPSIDSRNMESTNLKITPL